MYNKNRFEVKWIQHIAIKSYKRTFYKTAMNFHLWWPIRKNGKRNIAIYFSPRAFKELRSICWGEIEIYFLKEQSYYKIKQPYNQQK